MHWDLSRGWLPITTKKIHFVNNLKEGRRKKGGGEGGKERKKRE